MTGTEADQARQQFEDLRTLPNPFSGQSPAPPCTDLAATPAG
jgi:hypothetical protein